MFCGIAYVTNAPVLLLYADEMINFEFTPSVGTQTVQAQLIATHIINVVGVSHYEICSGQARRLS